jgi:hypothetical protein
MEVTALIQKLDGMDEEALVGAVVALRRPQMAALFEAAAGQPPLTLADLVPPDVPPLVPVIHEGKNSLPMFTRFQKRCCRPPGNPPDELWGYNEQSFRWHTGPGYFVVHHDDRGELVIDYTRLPPDKPPSWPRIIPNSARLGRFIYNGTVDVLRRVAGGVTIGRAFRRSGPMDAWFALVRREARA